MALDMVFGETIYRVHLMFQAEKWVFLVLVLWELK